MKTNEVIERLRSLRNIYPLSVAEDDALREAVRLLLREVKSVGQLADMPEGKQDPDPTTSPMTRPAGASAVVGSKEGHTDGIKEKHERCLLRSFH